MNGDLWLLCSLSAIPMWDNVGIHSWGKHNPNTFATKHPTRKHYRHNRNTGVIEINCNRKYCGWHYERWGDCGVHKEGEGIISNNRHQNVQHDRGRVNGWQRPKEVQWKILLKRQHTVKSRKTLDTVLWNLFCSDRWPANFMSKVVAWSFLCFKKTSLTAMSKMGRSNKISNVASYSINLLVT